MTTLKTTKAFLNRAFGQEEKVKIFTKYGTVLKGLVQTRPGEKNETVKIQGCLINIKDIVDFDYENETDIIIKNRLMTEEVREPTKEFIPVTPEAKRVFFNRYGSACVSVNVSIEWVDVKAVEFHNMGFNVKFVD